jgi:mannose-6-phosphate isomerase-like protein (cupin superfamily)
VTAGYPHPAPGAAHPPDSGSAPFRRIQAYMVNGMSQSVRRLPIEGTVVRSQNAYVTYGVCPGGANLPLGESAEERMLLLFHPSARIIVQADGVVADVLQDSVVILPPGSASLSAEGSFTLIHLEPVGASAVVDAAVNEGEYHDVDPRIAPYTRWPAPPAGYRLRVYPLSDAPAVNGVLGRIYTCSSLMVNVFEPQLGPRDPEALSPHSHEDFEQCSITIAGDYVHYVRTPWTSRQSHWRSDEAVTVESPSVAIIPAGVVHTTAAVGEGPHGLIDVFCPPRADFSGKPGWVRNGGDYPLTT